MINKQKMFRYLSKRLLTAGSNAVNSKDVAKDWDFFKAIFSNLHIVAPIMTLSGFLVYSNFKIQAFDKDINELRSDIKTLDSKLTGLMSNMDNKLTGLMGLYSLERIQLAVEGKSKEKGDSKEKIENKETESLK